MMINEELLKEDIIETLIENFDYSKEQANKFVARYLYEIIDAMYQAETDCIDEVMGREETKN